MNDQRVKHFAILTAAAGLSTWAIDMAATQVGLPSMQADLGISVTASQWILNITLMILAGIVTMGGALGDRMGRLRIFRWGIFGIIAGSMITAAGGLLNSFPIVLFGRGLEGLGAGFFLPASTALLVDVFALKERGAALGKMMMISMAITAFAPTLIGMIIQTISWPITYLLTAAAGVISLVLASKMKYDQILTQAKPFDIIGSVLLFLTIALLTMGIMRAGETGLTSFSVLMMVAAGLLVGAILVMISLRKENPLIQFRLFQIKTVSIAVFVVFMNYLPNVLMGAFVARFVQQAMGLSPTVTGLLMIVPVLMLVIAAPIGGKMLDQAGPRKPVILGICLFAGGLVFLGLGFMAQNLWLVIFGAALGGAGFSFTNPVQMAALSVTPLEQRGMLAGIFPVATNFGTALFVALLTAGMGILMASYQGANPGAVEADALSYALGILSWVSLLGTAATLLVSLRLPKKIEVSPDQPVNASGTPANN